MKIPALLSIILLFANCKSTKTTTSADNTKPNATLEGTYWKLYELNGKTITVSSETKKEPHLILQASDSTIKGHGGCNGFGGRYELGKMERIKFSQVISTMMACDNTPAENEFFKTLEKADSYYLKGDTLILNRARMAPLARFSAVYLK